MIGALLLLDYMFFEDEGACQFQPWRCVCKFKCCDCYCLGCIFPCSCNCPAKEPEEGAGAPFAVDVVELMKRRRPRSSRARSSRRGRPPPERL